MSVSIPSPISAPDQALWFYADANNQPVGPVPFSELQRLSIVGIVAGTTHVIEEGGSEWRTFCEVSSSQQGKLPISAPQPAATGATQTTSIRWLRTLALLLLWPAGLWMLFRKDGFRPQERILFLVLFWPAGLCVLWRASSRFPKAGKWAARGFVTGFATLLVIGMLSPHEPTGSTDLPGNFPASSSSHSGAAPEARRNPKLPDGPRYGIQKGGGGFTDRDGVLELQEVKQSFPSEEQQRKALRELRLRHEKEGRRLDFTRDYVVRILKEEPELDGFCEVIAEDARGLKSPRFWVHKSMLQSSDSLFGSQIVSGYMVFQGNEGTEVGGADVSDLLDLLVAVYDGEISEAEARKCVFMPGAQRGELENVIGKYAIYQARYATWRELVTFAMPIVDGDDDPLHTVPVRYVGREQFTTRGGLVRSIPVVVPHNAEN